MRWYLAAAYPGVRCAPDVRFGRHARVRAFAGGRIELQRGVELGDDALIIAEHGSVVLESGASAGKGAVIVARERITIGSGTLIAEYVSIRDQDHVHGAPGPLAAQGFVTAPIEIGRNVWIGAHVTVTRGVAIGDHAVVGANAMVTRTLPPAGRYGGVPARPLPAREPAA